MHARHAKNVAGDFYTTGECLDCGLPEHEAPQCLAALDDNDSVTHFVRQPETEDEIDSVCWAAYVCCNNAIRYGGTNPDIIRRMGNRPEYCDHLLPGGPIWTPMDQQRKEHHEAALARKAAQLDAEPKPIRWWRKKS